jgi:Zn-dependent peptidase ImmA (M78 family)/DNA-binding XRE family transcriptional regulator
MGLDVSEVSKEIGIQPNTIERWEKGDKTSSKPTLDTLLKLADVYKRPISAFYLPQPMKEPPLPKDFRRLSLKEGKISPNARYLIRKTQYLQEVSNELLDELDEDLNPQINSVLLTDDPEYVARYERASSGFSPINQKGWNDHYEAFRHWKKFIESKNIMVFQFSFDERNIRGFVLKDMKPYVIVLNSTSKEHISPRIFTLLHEYAHILLKESHSALCYPGDIPVEGYSKEAEMERWCDDFAGCFLMPRDPFIKDFSSDLNFERIRWLHNKYWVSNLAVLTRLYRLDEIKWPQYESQRDIITQRDFKPDDTRSGGSNEPVKTTIRERGGKFCSIVLESNNRNIITTNDALEYLDIKLSNINELKKELATNV